MGGILEENTMHKAEESEYKNIFKDLNINNSFNEERKDIVSGKQDHELFKTCIKGLLQIKRTVIEILKFIGVLQ